MSNIWIFHHIDGDGFGAAAVIASKFCQVDTDSQVVSLDENVHLIPVNFNNPIDFSPIKENDTVYMLDYTSSRSDDIASMNDLWDKFQDRINYIHIDHHKSALTVIEKCRGLKEYLKIQGGIFSTEEFNQAGCMLTFIAENVGLEVFSNIFWNYYFEERYASSPRIVKDINKLFALTLTEHEAPKWLQLTGDHDIYAEKYIESHIFAKGVFYNGLNKTYLDLNDNSFLKLTMIERSQRFALSYVLDERAEELYVYGKSIKDTMDRHYKKCLRCSFEIYVHLSVSKEYIDPANKMKLNYDDDGMLRAEGKILCVEGIGNSEVFLDEFEKYDAVILFSFDGEQIKHSIYSKKSSTFPCNALALWGGNFFGISGGGHDHAAGFYTENLFFKKERMYFLSDRRWKILTKDEIPEDYKDVFNKEG